MLQQMVDGVVRPARAGQQRRRLASACVPRLVAAPIAGLLRSAAGGKSAGEVVFHGVAGRRRGEARALQQEVEGMRSSIGDGGGGEAREQA